MISLKKHHFPRIAQYWGSHRAIFRVLESFFLTGYTSGLFFAVLPVFAAYTLGSEVRAGLFISALTALQVFLLNPLAGRIADQKGSLFTMRLSFSIEVVGALAWIIFPSLFTKILFFLGYFGRLAFHIVDSYLLKKGDRDEGGFLFGLRDEMRSLGLFLGLMCLPYFMFVETWDYLPWISLTVLGTSFLCITGIPDAKIPGAKKTKPKKTKSLFNPLVTVSTAVNFIKKNHQFPLFAIGSSIFEGIFYGSLWFLVPLHLAATTTNPENSLSLGIYELVTFFFAALCGLMADRIDWKKIEIFSWSLTMVLLWMMTSWHSEFMLVVLGFCIGLTNNLFVSASYHALMCFDEDHEEDGQFSAFSRMITDTGYMVAPVVCGFLYQYYGFQAGLFFVATVLSVLGLWMIALTQKLKPYAVSRGE